MCLVRWDKHSALQLNVITLSLKTQYCFSKLATVLLYCLGMDKVPHAHIISYQGLHSKPNSNQVPINWQFPPIISPLAGGQLAQESKKLLLSVASGVANSPGDNWWEYPEIFFLHFLGKNWYFPDVSTNGCCDG